MLLNVVNLFTGVFGEHPSIGDAADCGGLWRAEQIDGTVDVVDTGVVYRAAATIGRVKEPLCRSRTCLHSVYRGHGNW